MKAIKLSLIALITITLGSCLNDDDVIELSGAMFKDINIRSIGPGSYAGRISEILVHPDNDSIIFVSPSTGGVFKTTNNGESWQAVFDNAGLSLAIGDMDISQNNPDLLWVATGEASGEQNPASIGDGIYSSEDGGYTWVNKGLSDTRHFSKVQIHPEDDNIVFAGACGSRWGADEERGVFRTINAGSSWEKVLFINNNTGIADIALHPDGETIFATAWEQRRSAWAHVKQGPNSGIYKSEDGGDNWAKCNDGLPMDKSGRIALAIAASNPEIIYACYEHDSLGLFRSDDRGNTWQNVNNLVSTSYWYGRIYVDPTDSDHIYIMGMFIQESLDGGKTFSPLIPGRGVHVDHHVLWINPDNTSHQLLGNDGGLYITYSDGKSWEFIANLPIGQYYNISVDNRDPYWVYGGLQDNGVWGGPSRSDNGRPVVNSDIVFINGGDGFYSASDPEDPDIVYAESQYGYMTKFNHKTGKRERIKPKQEEGKDKYRFNWNTPFFISSHPDHELYAGAQMLLKSSDGGSNWIEISNDLSNPFDLDTIMVIGQKASLKPYFTITALSESPIQKGLIYAGTDDGNLFLTKDDGESWEDLSSNIPAPIDRFFSRVLASSHSEGRVYIAFGRFYEANDLSPYIFLSDDYGKTWTEIRNNLPDIAVIRAISEHPSNPDLIFTGTHNSLYVSINRGQDWVAAQTNLPNVAVDDIIIQESENDLVLGTYGRGIWILDNINFLSDLLPTNLNEEHILFDPKYIESKLRPDSIFKAEKYNFVAPENKSGIMITYYLKKDYAPDSRKKPELLVISQKGEEILLQLPTINKGFGRLIWNPGKAGKYELIFSTRKKVTSKAILIE